ncbi:MAG: Trp family transcriptional regulator [bacterium]|nr:Trp family transcriptional regulator [bacterium]
MRKNEDYEWELVNVLSRVAPNKELLRKFMRDLLSPYEFMDLANRWQIVKQLHEKIPHRRIARNLKTSIVTINRGSRMYQNKSGGFNQVLNKYGK